MAITSLNAMGTGSSSASSSSFTLAATQILNVDNIGIITISSNNTESADGASTDVTSVTDAASNTYTKLGEYTNGEGAAGAGVLVSVWMTQATSELAVGQLVTINLASAITDKCASMWEFSVASGNTLQIASGGGPDYLATDASNGFGSDTISGLSSKEYLFFRGLAKEANGTTNITVSSGFAAISAARSRNNAAAVMVRGEFDIVTATSATSNPTLAISGDTASVMVALEEVTPSSEYNETASGGATVGGTVTEQINFSPSISGGSTAAGSPNPSLVMVADVCSGGAGGAFSSAFDCSAFDGSCGGCGVVVGGESTVSVGSGGNTYNETMSGGVVVAGDSSISISITPQVSGGVVVAGDSSISISITPQVSGGVVVAGDSNFNVSITESTNGGAVSGGESLVFTTYTATSSGGVVVGGSAHLESSGYDEIATGGAVAGGIAEVNFITNITASGGVVCCGTSSSLVQYTIETSGGGIVGGSAYLESSGFNEVASGGIISGGSAEVNFINNITASGGVVCSGTSSSLVQYTLETSGGVVVSGLSIPIVRFTLTPSGGVVIGGEVTETYDNGTFTPQVFCLDSSFDNTHDLTSVANTPIALLSSATSLNTLGSTWEDCEL